MTDTAAIIDRAELLASLELDEGELVRYIGEGMPTAGDGFDIDAVSSWLVAHGHASPSGVVSTQGEVAKTFGVQLDTVKGWRGSGMPGEPGAWDLAAIDAWKRSRARDPSHVIDPQTQANNARMRKQAAEARVAEVRAEIMQRKNATEAGEMVPRDDVVRNVAMAFTFAKTRLEAIPDALMMRFPPDVRLQVAEELRHDIRLILTKMAAETINEEDMYTTWGALVIEAADALKAGTYGPPPVCDPKRCPSTDRPPGTRDDRDSEPLVGD